MMKPQTIIRHLSISGGGINPLIHIMKVDWIPTPNPLCAVPFRVERMHALNKGLSPADGGAAAGLGFPALPVDMPQETGLWK